MLRYWITVLLAISLDLPAIAAITPDQIAQLPPPASHAIDFAKEIKPIFEASCIKCHGHGRDKGGFKIDTRETMLKGGDSGAAVVPGKSVDSYLVELVQGFDPDSMMPKKGTKLTPEQIGLLRAWIDQGMKWDASVSFGRTEPINLNPREPRIPEGSARDNPIDRFLKPYFDSHQIKPSAPVSDRVYARRVYLDILGLIPSPEALAAFEKDGHADKRERLVRALLADNPNYAQHWLTFWNDALRNDYRGTGYIDGGRKQITSWLYSALATNMPFDKFVAELVNPMPESEGFTKGIVWRGVVNASQTPQMQTAQNISQVFMGVNLKCASCHDSFINDLMLSDAYGLAGIYSDKPLEMVHCDKPTGKIAELRFLYPELGRIDANADKKERLKQLAAIITGRQDGRLTRTMVNRLWQRFLGRGLVEPVDDMEKPAWDADLLDWLAEDLANNHYDLKHTIELILTSQAYQMPAVSLDEKSNEDYAFRGPMVRRMSAEEFCDAVSELTGIWHDAPAGQIDFSLGTTNRHEKVKTAPAMWIWSGKDSNKSAAPGTVYFRKTFQLSRVPSRAMILLTADNSFTLYVNGSKIGSGKNYQRIDTFDVKSKLAQGRNVIAISAVNDTDTPNPAGLFVYAWLRNEQEGKPAEALDFGSDSTWVQTSNKERGWEKPAFAAEGWAGAAELGGINIEPWKLGGQFETALVTPESYGTVRASLVTADPLMVALGRPNREQTVTTRLSAATTLQALELTNGHQLADLLHRGAEKMAGDEQQSGDKLVSALYEKALGRKPTAAELSLAAEMLGHPVKTEGVEDLLWAVTMLPEFQLIY